MSLLDNQYLNKIKAAGLAAIHEIQDYVIHPLVHSIEQPIQNIWNDSKEVVHSLTTVSENLVRLGTYWAMGWLAWNAFEMYFPDEAGSVNESIDRALKRARIR